MKSKLYREGRPRPLIVTLVLLLTIAAVGTTPWALAKYAATGTGTASARVASWSPQFYQEPGSLSAAYLNGAWYDGTATSTGSFCILTGSEVSTNIKVQIRCSESDATAVTASSPSITFPTNQINAANQGIAHLTNNYPTGSPGSGTVIQNSPVDFNYAPTSWVWFDSLGVKATSPAPAIVSNAATNVNNCMRIYKVYFDAVQID